MAIIKRQSTKWVIEVEVEYTGDRNPELRKDWVRCRIQEFVTKELIETLHQLRYDGEL